ncbi:MAG: FAD-dependent oxidoreductase, partial [Fibrobacteres bacterium]|nr:FAD-dependent oxidoreductase [Fibrobacterota bacterium]
YIKGSEWESEVLNGGLVAVDFYSTECPPCEALAAKFEPLSEVYGRDVKFIKIFRQENRDLALSLGIKSSPTLLFYKNGNRVGDFLSGAIKRKEITKNLDEMIGEERAKAIRSTMKSSKSEYDVMILGGGPAGLAAAIYAAQAKAKTVIVDKALPGGQISITHQVSNYPGFIDPVPGYMLAHYMSEQAAKAGVFFKSAVDITSVDLKAKAVVADEFETVKAKKIIIATGASPRPLGIPGEKEYRGKGISYCGTCDAKYFDGKEVIVIGGGDTAIEESLFIAKFASKLSIFYRADKPRAKAEIQELAAKTPNITLVPKHKPLEISKESDGKMSVLFENGANGDKSKFTADGIFVFVGMNPNTADFNGTLETDEWGYIKIDKEMRTSIPDVFAVGDVAEKPIRQITVAVADGTIAAICATR